MRNFFKDISNEINHEYEPGIGAEIRSFIEYQGDDIKNFDLTFDKNSECFILKITTNDMKIDDVQQLFMKLVFFLEYSHVTFYTTENTENSLHYQLISYSKNNKGFILDVEMYWTNIIFFSCIIKGLDVLGEW